MLILSRKTRQQIHISGGIVITIVQVKGKSVRLGIEAPAEVKVLRGELTVEAADRRTESGEAGPAPIRATRESDRTSHSESRRETARRGPEEAPSHVGELENDPFDGGKPSDWSIIRRTSRTSQRPLKRFIRRDSATTPLLVETV